MSIDISKLSGAVDRLAADDKKIREGLRDFGKLIDRDKENLRSIITEAASREVDHRRQVYNILKKLFKDYQTEMSSGVNILFTLTDRQDRTLSLAKKMSKGGTA